jgi:protein dithiol oxidoreductase (disulfide-forming)
MRGYIVLAALLALVANSSADAQTWTEGKNYFTIVPAQHTNVPAGKIEVTEIFSYGCPYCAQFDPYVQALGKQLPGNVVLDFVPASFIPAEDWPMFQRAACTAQMLGIFDRTHAAMFDAVWKTAELAIYDQTSQRLKNPLPTIEDAARYYNRISGVPVDKFLATARSFAVDVRMKSDDALVEAYQVTGTPTMIVNGKYRVDTTSAGGFQQTIELVKWLLTKESK